MKHQSANTEERNTPWKPKTTAGSWKRTRSHVRQIGSPQRAPTGTKVTETWQPGVIKSKISTDHTYLVATNFWSPLDDNYEEEEEEEEEEDKEEFNMIK